MPSKYYCPKCDKRFIDWGAEKLGFKCPDCTDSTLYRVGSHPEGDGAPSLSKSGAKRKVKAKAKVAPDLGVDFEDTEADALLVGAGDEALDDDVGLDDAEGDVIGDVGLDDD